MDLDSISKISWLLLAIITLAIFYFFRFEYLYKIGFLNKKRIAFWELQSLLIKNRRKQKKIPSQILHEFFAEKKEFLNIQHENAFVFWYKVYLVDQDELIDSLLNSKFSKALLLKFQELDFNSTQIQYHNISEEDTKLENIPKPKLSENELKDRLVKKGVELVENAINGSKTAQLFKRFGYFAIALGAVKAFPKSQKEKLKAWKEEVGKVIDIPKNFANDPRLMDHPFKITKNWTAKSNASDAEKIYRFFKNIEWKEALILLKTEIDLNRGIASKVNPNIIKDLRNNYTN
jgi:hypothetical protein